MMGQETRAKLMDYRATHKIKEREEFIILTNRIHEEWAGVNTQTLARVYRVLEVSVRCGRMS
jgi:hypothetical protein